MASILNVDQIGHSTSGTAGLQINSSGQVTLPAVPYIRMRSIGTVSVTTSNGRGTVPYNDVIASQGITLDTSYYQFQVPVTGLYHFSGAVRLDKASSYLWWRVEDSNGVSLEDSALILNNGNSGSFTTSAGSFLCPLTASTDYLIGFGDGGNSTANINPSQTFMGIHLVG